MRSERLQDRPGGLKNRAIVPSTGWFEMKKPERVWHEFALDNRALFGMAAITQRGRTTDGEWFTCYSVVMRPAPPHLAAIHDRVPVLIPPALSHEWLTAEPTREIIDEAIASSEAVTERVSATARTGRP